MTQHRLVPFARFEKTGNGMTLHTPDTRLEGLPGTCVTELETLYRDWSEPSSLSTKLLAAGAVTDGSIPEYNLLFRVEEYLRGVGNEVRAIRRGSSSPKTALPLPAYRACALDGNEGFGMDTSAYLALVKAVAELYERDACAENRNHAQVHGEPLETVLRPVKYTDWQLRSPQFPFGEASSGKYVNVADPVTGYRASLPAELALYPYDGWPRCGVASSNGVAAHTDYDRALLRSAFELIERDALMQHWYKELPREQLIPPVAFIERIERIQALKFEVLFLNLTLELAPVVLAIARRPVGLQPRMLLGLGCDSDAERAFNKALEEVESMVSYVGLPIQKPDLRLEDVREVMDHEYWYNQGDNSDAILSLIGSKVESLSAIAPGPTTVPGLWRRVYGSGFRWYAMEHNLQGARRTGLHVVRSVIPELTPIGFGYRMEPLGHPRLRHSSGSSKAGNTPRRLTELGYKLQPFA